MIGLTFDKRHGNLVLVILEIAQQMILFVRFTSVDESKHRNSTHTHVYMV